MAGPLTLSMKELDRLQVLTRIAERRLTRRRAAGLLQIGERQVRRLYRAFVQDGAAGLVSRRRGRPSRSVFQPTHPGGDIRPARPRRWRCRRAVTIALRRLSL